MYRTTLLSNKSYRNRKEITAFSQKMSMESSRKVTGASDKRVNASAERNREPILKVRSECGCGQDSDTSRAAGVAGDSSLRQESHCSGDCLRNRNSRRILRPPPPTRILVRWKIIFLSLALASQLQAPSLLMLARLLMVLVYRQPSECDPANLDSIKAYKDEQDNILEPLLLDVIHPVDIGRVFDFILNINMIHISPWSATLGLFANANKLLRTEGISVAVR